MKRFWPIALTAILLSACGDGNPFTPIDGGGEGEPGGSTIPEELLGNLESVTYDPATQTLIVRGMEFDDTPYEAVYVRKPGLDRAGYEAYTSQDGSLDRHNTAYVKQNDGTFAGIVMAGGQFQQVFSGSTYGRDGAYDPPTVGPDSGLATYAGRYVGLLNASGDGGDLLPVTPGTPTSPLPVQAAELTGDVVITADFADNAVAGVVYNRVVVDGFDGIAGGAVAVEDVALRSTAIQADGTFSGEAVQNANTTVVGTYGGIFGGEDASTVAGVLRTENHIDLVTGELEVGTFVLIQCGLPGEDPICNQPVP